MDATEYELRKQIEILGEKINLISNHLQIMFIHDDDVNTVQLIDLKDDTD